MTWLGWIILGLAVWAVGALGFADELAEVLRSRGPGRDDDQGGADLRLECPLALCIF